MDQLCSICGRRRATRTDMIEGKRRPACEECAGPVVPRKGPTRQERVLEMIRRQPGLTSTEIAATMDDSRRGRARVFAVVARLKNKQLIACSERDKTDHGMRLFPIYPGGSK